jgi:DNA-binding XRE family transcriptional regulator
MGPGLVFDLRPKVRYYKSTPLYVGRLTMYDGIIWDLDDDPDGNCLRSTAEAMIMAMKRIVRDRRLTTEEAAKYRKVREQIDGELPELVARHHDRMAALDELQEVLGELKAAREELGLSLADVTKLTGMDRSALSKLETGQRQNPTFETLVRYAEAVGKRLVVSLADA